MITERCPPPDWMDENDAELREKSGVALAERIDYLMAATDDSGPESRTLRLERLCRELELPERVVELILTRARSEDETDRAE